MSAIGRRVISRLRLVAIAAVLVTLFDQLSKAVVIRKLPAGDAPVGILPYVTLDHVSNTGAAFSLFAGARWMLVLMAGIILAVIVVMAVKHERGDRLSMIALGAIAGGAMGNLIDRVRFGAVTDFIDIGAWPTFNVADICIVTGVALVIIQSWRLRTVEEVV